LSWWIQVPAVNEVTWILARKAALAPAEAAIDARSLFIVSSGTVRAMW
jgi:hypothetical protein